MNITHFSKHNVLCHVKLIACVAQKSTEGCGTDGKSLQHLPMLVYAVYVHATRNTLRHILL